SAQELRNSTGDPSAKPQDDKGVIQNSADSVGDTGRRGAGEGEAGNNDISLEELLSLLNNEGLNPDEKMEVITLLADQHFSNPDALPAILSLITRDEDPDVIAYICFKIENVEWDMRDARTLPLLTALLDFNVSGPMATRIKQQKLSAMVRECAIYLLGYSKTQNVAIFDKLLEIVVVPLVQRKPKAAAIRSLHMLGYQSTRYIRALITTLDDREYFDAVMAAVETLSEIFQYNNWLARSDVACGFVRALEIALHRALAEDVFSWNWKSLFSKLRNVVGLDHRVTTDTFGDEQRLAIAANILSRKLLPQENQALLKAREENELFRKRKILQDGGFKKDTSTRYRGVGEISILVSSGLAGMDFEMPTLEPTGGNSHP
ncbi:MAG: hypothetical protein HYS98_08690, partial [Deltaproteobacteria bacterium]|nr:hypothetical protein [Deltaproteobacteria bacterium]